MFTGKAPLKQAKKVVKKNVYNIKQNTKNKETKNVILKKVFDTPTKEKIYGRTSNSEATFLWLSSQR